MTDPKAYKAVGIVGIALVLVGMFTLFFVSFILGLIVELIGLVILFFGVSKPMKKEDWYEEGTSPFMQSK